MTKPESVSERYTAARLQPLLVQAIRYSGTREDGSQIVEVYQLRFEFGVKGYDAWFGKEMLGLGTQTRENEEPNTLITYKDPQTGKMVTTEHNVAEVPWQGWLTYVDMQRLPLDFEEDIRRGRKGSRVQKLTTWRDRHVAKRAR